MEKTKLSDSTARLNLHPVCRLGGLGLDSTHRPPHCPVHHGKKASRYLEFLVLSGTAVPSGHSSLVLQTKAVSVPQNVQAACPSFGRVSTSGCFLWRQLLLSLRMGSVQLEKDTSPRLRECPTTTAPLTRLCRSLAGGETHQVVFFQDGLTGGTATETETVQQPVLLLGCGGSMGAGVLLLLCVWPQSGQGTIG